MLARGIEEDNSEGIICCFAVILVTAKQQMKWFTNRDLEERGLMFNTPHLLNGAVEGVILKSEQK